MKNIISAFDLLCGPTMAWVGGTHGGACRCATIYYTPLHLMFIVGVQNFEYASLSSIYGWSYSQKTKSLTISALAKQWYQENVKASLNPMSIDYINCHQKAQFNTNNIWLGGGCSGVDGFGKRFDAARVDSLLHQMWTLHMTLEFSFICWLAQTYKRIIVAMMSQSSRPGRSTARRNGAAEHRWKTWQRSQ